MYFRSGCSAGMPIGCVLAPMVVAGVCGCAIGHSAISKGVHVCVYCMCRDIIMPLTNCVLDIQLVMHSYDTYPHITRIHTHTHTTHACIHGYVYAMHTQVCSHTTLYYTTLHAYAKLHYTDTLHMHTYIPCTHKYVHTLHYASRIH